MHSVLLLKTSCVNENITWKLNSIFLEEKDIGGNATVLLTWKTVDIILQGCWKLTFVGFYYTQNIKDNRIYS